MAENGDEMCRKIFAVQAHALGLFFDAMINTFDPDALIVGGGALETKEEFQHWFLDEIRKSMPNQREEQADIPIYVMPKRRHGRRARSGYRGASLYPAECVGWRSSLSYMFLTTLDLDIRSIGTFLSDSGYNTERLAQELELGDGLYATGENLAPLLLKTEGDAVLPVLARLFYVGWPVDAARW